MSDPKVSVLVRVDLDGRHLPLVVTGFLTCANQHGLQPVIDRARTLTPAAEVVLDLSACTPLEPGAVKLLRAGLEQKCPDQPGGTMKIVPPASAGPTEQTHRAQAVVPGGDPLGGFAGQGSW